ncbi:helix-turn-helix domain-containing protein [Nocardia wallacei]|uniref:GbsR/MarR family transcriptional regulator n=1 Tax=Nocardia wallacei TaxID=480035 RepID=UPI003CC7E257
MAGGRLSLHDRECIATGLADGLGFAQIARDLDRPTSTISREVGRNGGPDRYRADRAELAAKARARRRRDARRPAAEVDETPEHVREYSAHLTEVLARTGIPRLTARVMASLYISETGSHTAAELSRRLGVSPASVSAAIGFLEEQGLIRRERGDGRRDRYIVDGSAWSRALLTSLRANEAIARTAHRGVTVLGPATTAGARLAHLHRFLDHVNHELARVLADWQARAR